MVIGYLLACRELTSVKGAKRGKAVYYVRGIVRIFGIVTAKSLCVLSNSVIFGVLKIGVKRQSIRADCLAKKAVCKFV